MNGTHPLACLPVALVCARLTAAPILAVMLSSGHVGPTFYVVLIFALVSDILDGVIARKIGTSTARLRVLDSIADTALYAGLAIAAAIAHHSDVIALETPIGVLVAGLLALYAFSFARFGRAPSYHGVTAKAWGLGLTLAFAMIASNTDVRAWIWYALLLGYVNTIDELITTAILPAWQTDVLTISHALRIRRLRNGKDLSRERFAA